MQHGFDRRGGEGSGVSKWGERDAVEAPQRRNYDAKQLRDKPVVRKNVDFNSVCARYTLCRAWIKDGRDRPLIHASEDCIKDMDPVFSVGQENASHAFCTKYVHHAVDKMDRTPVNVVCYMPNGTRVISATQSGGFTLWNDLGFNFATRQTAHDRAVRAMSWTHDGRWLVSADDGGVIKYWQPSMANVKVFSAHQAPVRDVSFSPLDTKLATCSDDQSVKVWDFATLKEEAAMAGGEKGHHGWDVKSVQWHPYKGLLLSGSKDNTMKLWDPRAGGRLLNTIYGHKNTVIRVRWNENGRWFLSASRDWLLKAWDLRNLAQGAFQTFRGHNKDVTCVEWHPHVEQMFTSGGFDGSIHHWLVSEPHSQAEIHAAHDNSVSSIAWHPLGHVLVSGSHDHSTRFWTRNRPGDEMRDTYNLNQLPEEEKQQALADLADAAKLNPQSLRFRKVPSLLENYRAEEESPLGLAAASAGQDGGMPVIPGLLGRDAAVAGSDSSKKAASMLTPHIPLPNIAAADNSGPLRNRGSRESVAIENKAETRQTLSKPYSQTRQTPSSAYSQAETRQPQSHAYPMAETRQIPRDARQLPSNAYSMAETRQTQSISYSLARNRDSYDDGMDRSRGSDDMYSDRGRPSEARDYHRRSRSPSPDRYVRDRDMRGRWSGEYGDRSSRYYDRVPGDSAQGGGAPPIRAVWPPSNVPTERSRQQQSSRLDGSNPNHHYQNPGSRPFY